MFGLLVEDILCACVCVCVFFYVVIFFDFVDFACSKRFFNFRQYSFVFWVKQIHFIYVFTEDGIVNPSPTKEIKQGQKQT